MTLCYSCECDDRACFLRVDERSDAGAPYYCQATGKVCNWEETPYLDEYMISRLLENGDRHFEEIDAWSDESELPDRIKKIYQDAWEYTNNDRVRLDRRWRESVAERVGADFGTESTDDLTGRVKEYDKMELAKAFAALGFGFGLFAKDVK